MTSGTPPAVLRPAPDLVRARVPLGEGLEATAVRRGEPPDLAGLAGRTGLLGVSVRNPRFSNALVAAFARFCRTHLAGGIVTVVDRPYERNVAAAARGAAWEAEERAKLARIAEETRRRASRALAREGGPAVRLVAWDDLVAATPASIGEQVRAGFARRGRFHGDVLAQTRAAVPGLASDGVVERYAEFLLEELPVLLHAYYGGPAEVVDVYPGPQPDLFWRLEAGDYADEMPDLARRLDVRGGLVYLDLRPRPTWRDAGVPARRP